MLRYVMQTNEIETLLGRRSFGRAENLLLNQSDNDG